MLGHKPPTDPIPSTSVLDDQDPQSSQAHRLRRRDALIGGAGLGISVLLGACSTKKPGIPATTVSAGISAETVGSTPSAETLKIAQLGVATPDRLSKIDGANALVEEFTLYDKYVKDSQDPAMAIIESCIYLRVALSTAGTTPAEIASFGRDSAKYLEYVKRFNTPALKAMTGKEPTGTGLEQRHEFVAARAYYVQQYDKTEHLEVTAAVNRGSVRITKGSYESGKFSAEFSVKLSDNLESTQAHRNDPDVTSINGTDTFVSTFTKVGDEWVDESTGSYTADTAK